MAGLYDGLEEAPSSAARAPVSAPPALTNIPTPAAPPAGLYDGLEEAGPKQASGVIEHLQAGFQGSVAGLAWRQRLPDLVMNPEHSKWWERAATGIAQVAADLPIMIPAGAKGGALGAAGGAAVAGPVGAAVGGVLTGGAAMFAAPAALRESLIQAYKARDAATGADWFNIVREVATHTAKEGMIGAATMGAGGLAARTIGKAIAPSIGTGMGVGTATKVIGTTDVAAQIAAMTTIPAALQGRLPDLQEFMDAAIVIGGLKVGHHVVDRMMTTYQRTGKTPAEQVQDAQTDPKVAEEITRPPVDPVTSTTSGVPVKLDRLIAEAELLARGGVPEAPNIKAIIKEIKDAGPQQGDMLRDVERIGSLAEAAREKPLTGPEKAELETLRARVVEMGKGSPGEPVGITEETRKTSAQVVHDDVLRQVKEADEARVAAGLKPLGDDHAQAVAALVRARVRTRAARLGMLPEDVYRESGLQIRDESAKVVAEEAAAVPRGAPTFTPPEVDLFGEPVAPQVVPRVGLEGLATVEVPLADLVLSKEVPQFKHAADEKGVIVPLGGAFDRTGVGPIQVWERLDGRQEVISGRHRLDLARRSGEETIPAQVHREADGFTREMAARLDAELNIREEQGSTADYAQFFKDSGLSKEDAEQRGLLARHKGRSGFTIARDGSADLLAAHRAGLLSDEAALTISTAAPGSERLQALGMAMVNEGKSALIAVNTMRAVDLMAAERKAAGAQGDIFGFDDSAMIEASMMAKRAASMQRRISEQIAAVSGAAKRPELARKMGVDVADPEGIQKKIVALRQDQYMLDNWHLHPELVAKIRAPEGGVTGREGDLRQEPADDFALQPETPAELAARNQEALEAARRKVNQEAAADRAEKRAAEKMMAQHPDLFDTQGKLFQGTVHVEREDGAPLLRHGNVEFIEPRLWDRHTDGGFGWEHVVEIGGKDEAVVSLTWKDGQITQLHNIRTYGEKEQGTGTAILRAVLTHNAPETTVWLRHVLPEARAWWEKRGAKFFETEEGEDGTLTRVDFEAANPVKRGDRQDARAAGEGEAAQEGNAAGVEGQATLERARESAVRKEVNGDRAPKVALDKLLQEHRGSYEVAENLITIMQGADRSTVLHEMGHSWLEEMRADAKRPNAPEQIRNDWETLRRELAIGADGTISRQSHEQFARSVERYLGEGHAPSVELRGVFERFKAWLLEIYNDLRNLNVQINPDVREVMDRMLATDQEIADARALNVPTRYVAEAKAEEARKIVPGFKAEQVALEPYADELPKGPGEAPDNSHVNYAYINTPLDVKLTMQRMAEIDQENIQKQRGGTNGVKSWAESNAEQAKYVNDILGGGEDTLRLLSPRDPDAAGPDVRLGILKKLAVGAAKDSARLRDVVLEAGHDATVRQQLEYLGSIERARMIQAEFLGERASVARALNALKDVTEGSGEISRMLDAIGYGERAATELFQTARTPAEEQTAMRRKLDEILLNYKGKTVLDIAKLHKEIGTLKGTFKLAKDIEKATTWEMLVEGWRAGLLSGPVTHTTNLFGTGAFQALRPPVDALAAIIGMARGASPGMGESDRASMSEAVARMTGMLGGVQDGLKVAVATFKLDDPTGKTEAYRTAIQGRAGELIRIPLRLMGAEDALVTTMYRRGEMRGLAIRQAFDENMNPGTREFAERVDHLLDHPTPEMTEAADAAATRMTFNSPLGEKGVALQGFVNKWNLQWMVPFIRTPINIAKELGRMSPFAPIVGEWRADIAKGGVARDRALAEMALGSGIMAVTMAYAFSGQITGGPSPDPGKQRGKAGVSQPYSVLVGDTWYEYARIAPTGTLMGIAADLAAVWDHMNDEEKDKIPKLLSVAFSNAVTNQTFLQGITNFVNATSEPARFGPRFVQQLAASTVPNVIGQPTTMADPVVREVNSMLEAVQARIPGMRQDLLPKRDWLGAPVETKERLGVVGPVREQKVSEDKVRLEAARLDISMAAAPKKTHIGKGTGKLGDVELTPEERNKFQQVGGDMAHRILGNVVNAPGYDQIPDLVKRQIFSKILTASHRVAAVQALPMDKRVSYLQSITEKMTAELSPTE